MKYAIKVIWQGGTEDYVKEGLGPDACVATFANRREANRQRDFMAMGFDEDEIQSINVVEAPGDAYRVSSVSLAATPEEAFEGRKRN